MSDPSVNITRSQLLLYQPHPPVPFQETLSLPVLSWLGIVTKSSQSLIKIAGCRPFVFCFGLVFGPSCQVCLFKFGSRQVPHPPDFRKLAVSPCRRCYNGANTCLQTTSTWRRNKGPVRLSFPTFSNFYRLHLLKLQLSLMQSCSERPSNKQFIFIT